MVRHINYQGEAFGRTNASPLQTICKLSEDVYDIGPIRPPSEAGSLLIRVNRNCPWNKCEFCPVYKGRKFEKKSAEEIEQDIDKALIYYGSHAKSITRAFLQDADALLMKTAELVEVLRYLKGKFPSINRITAYARTPTLERKTLDELIQLREAGLSRIHTGLESGYAPLLQYINKGTTPDQQIDAGRKVKQAGISHSEYIMPGLGGKAMSSEHALETARVLNAINPDFIRIRTTSVQPSTPLFDKMEKGEFELLSDVEVIEELRLLIENLDGISSTLVSDHMLNLLQELKGTFPDDKQKLLDIIDRFLALPADEKRLFQVGVRMGIMRDIEHLNDPIMRAYTEDMVNRINSICARRDGFTVDGFLHEIFYGRL